MCDPMSDPMNNPMCDRSHVGLLQVFKSGGSSSGLFAAKEVLGPSDMQLGAVITVFSRGFELSEAEAHGAEPRRSTRTPASTRQEGGEGEGGHSSLLNACINAGLQL